MDISIIQGSVASHNFCLSIPSNSATIERYINLLYADGRFPSCVGVCAKPLLHSY